MRGNERPSLRQMAWAGVLAAAIFVMGFGGYQVLADDEVATIGSLSADEPAANLTQGVDPNDDLAVEETAAPVGRAPADLGSASSAEAIAPTLVSVPEMDIAAPIDALGVAGDQMAVPEDGDRVGWYKYGSSPLSESGSTVLAGHVDTSEGFGAMAPLRQAGLGTEIIVELSDGSSVTYEVVGREQFSKTALPVSDLFDRDGPERLVLITCSGQWREDLGSYTDNVVVAAVPVSSG